MPRRCGDRRRPGGQLGYPDCLRSVPVDSRSKFLTGCPGDLRQAVLDEVDAMHKAGKVRNPIGLLSVLARKAGLGLFAPNYSIRVDISRPVAERWAEDQRTQRPASLAVEPTAVSELGRRVLSDLRKRLSPEAPTGDEPASSGRRRNDAGAPWLTLGLRKKS